MAWSAALVSIPLGAANVYFFAQSPLTLAAALIIALIMDCVVFGSRRPAPTSSKKSDAIGAKNVSIIVPTYKEALNLKDLVNRIHQACTTAGLTHEIIIVDDNSNDGSVEVIDKLQKQKIPVQIEVRTKERGLSSAVVHGFKLAQHDILVCMDADLSHPPEQIAEFVLEISRDQADFVLGSRYIAGGRSEHTPIRWLISKAATLLAKPLVPALSDPMSGFFAMPKQRIQEALRDGVNAKGFKIGLELCLKAHVSCARQKEVAIVFKDRIHGQSKLTMKTQVHYLEQLALLYIYTFPKLFGGAVVGAGRIIASYL